MYNRRFDFDSVGSGGGGMPVCVFVVGGGGAGASVGGGAPPSGCCCGSFSFQPTLPYIKYGNKFLQIFKSKLPYTLCQLKLILGMSY